MKEGKERKTIWDNDEHKNGKNTEQEYKNTTL